MLMSCDQWCTGIGNGRPAKCKMNYLHCESIRETHIRHFHACANMKHYVHMCVCDCVHRLLKCGALWRHIYFKGRISYCLMGENKYFAGKDSWNPPFRKESVFLCLPPLFSHDKNKFQVFLDNMSFACVKLNDGMLMMLFMIWFY